MANQGQWMTDCVCGDNHTQDEDCITCKNQEMVCCDKCDTWKHLVCLGMEQDELPTEFVCPPCLEGKKGKKKNKKGVIPPPKPKTTPTSQKKDKKLPKKKEFAPQTPMSIPRDPFPRPGKPDTPSARGRTLRSSTRDETINYRERDEDSDETDPQQLPPLPEAPIFVANFVQQPQQLQLQQQQLEYYRPPSPRLVSATRGRPVSPCLYGPTPPNPLRRLSPPAYRPLTPPRSPLSSDKGDSDSDDHDVSVLVPAKHLRAALPHIALPFTKAGEKRRRRKNGLECPEKPETFDILPIEVRKYVMSFLDPSSLCVAASVSRRWRSLAYTPVLWHTLDLGHHATIASDTLLVSISSRLPNVRSVAVPACGQITDGALYTLSMCAERLDDLNMAFCTGITDDGVATLCSALPGLTRLNLAGCHQVAGAGVRAIAAMSRKLTSLDLSHTSPDDASIGRLGSLRLAFLSVFGCTKLSNEAVQRLSAQLPHGALVNTVTEYNVARQFPGIVLAGSAEVDAPIESTEIVEALVQSVVNGVDADAEGSAPNGAHDVKGGGGAQQETEPTPMDTQDGTGALLREAVARIETLSEAPAAPSRPKKHYPLREDATVAQCMRVGDQLIAEERPLEAIVAFERASRGTVFAPGTFHKPFCALARAYLRLRRVDKAMHYLYEAYRRAPGDEWTLKMLRAWTAGVRGGARHDVLLS